MINNTITGARTWHGEYDTVLVVPLLCKGTRQHFLLCIAKHFGHEYRWREEDFTGDSQYRAPQDAMQWRTVEDLVS